MSQKSLARSLSIAAKSGAHVPAREGRVCPRAVLPAAVRICITVTSRQEKSEIFDSSSDQLSLLALQVAALKRVTSGQEAEIVRYTKLVQQAEALFNDERETLA